MPKAAINTLHTFVLTGPVVIYLSLSVHVDPRFCIDDEFDCVAVLDCPNWFDWLTVFPDRFE